MDEFNVNKPHEEVEATSFDTKTWCYSEKNNKHVTNHKLTVSKNRFTHEAQVKEASQAMKQRTDISLKNVNSVNAYYGLSRNIRGTIIAALIAVLAFIGAIAMFASESTVVGVVLIVVAALLGLLAWLIYRTIKPAFILEIETLLPPGTAKNNAFAYGSATVSFGKKHHSAFFYLMLVVVWPIGIVYLLTHSRAKGNKYKFEMSPEVGNEIVDTLGAFLIEK